MTVFLSYGTAECSPNNNMSLTDQIVLDIHCILSKNMALIFLITSIWEANG